MVIGVGCDIVEIERIEKAMKKDGFLKRVFTEREIEYLALRNMKAESAAAGFAAKEAVSKALGTGISGFSMRDIEILHEENGRPYVRLTGGAKELLSKTGGTLSVSMSHSREYAIAYAVLDT
ncbi:MAG: holo-ACP synthase [Clostridia bacterium]|nr:holo-ACP synthase [Clostridia bacterium]